MRILEFGMRISDLGIGNADCGTSGFWNLDCGLRNEKTRIVTSQRRVVSREANPGFWNAPSACAAHY